MTSNRNGGSNVFVRVNLASLQKRLNITGEIWLQLGDFDFPSESWSDFPVIILSWWLDALDGLLSRSNRTSEFLFMDGPYSFKIARDNDECFLQCIRDPHGANESLWQGAVNPDNLLAQIHSAASNVVEQCRRAGWITRDTT